jgi:hypothetical protein
MDVAPLQYLAKRLLKWKPRPSEHAGCLQLFDSERCKNTLPLTDKNCPSLALVAHLTQQGWKFEDRRIEHVAVAAGAFDCANPIRYKQYYQVLVTLGDCLPLAGRIPSRQPVSFYSCLLLGQEVPPGLPDKDYKAVLKRLGPDAQSMVVVDADDDPPPLEDGDGALDLVPGRPPPPAPKRRRVDVPRRGGRNPSAAAPPPPLPLPPLPPPGVGGGTPPPESSGDESGPVDLVPAAPAPPPPLPDVARPRRNARESLPEFFAGCRDRLMKYEGLWHAPGPDRGPAIIGS